MLAVIGYLHPKTYRGSSGGSLNNGRRINVRYSGRSVDNVRRVSSRHRGRLSGMVSDNLCRLGRYMFRGSTRRLGI